MFEFSRYELLVGMPPFYHKNEQSMFTLAIQTAPTFHGYMNISSEAQSFITHLLHKDQHKRMGAKTGLPEIESHPWMTGFSFRDLIAKKMKAPFIPNEQ